MKHRMTLVLFAILILVFTELNVRAEDESAPRLAKKDREFLLGLIGKPLTDPTGKQYSSVKIIARNCWGSTAPARVAAWHQPARDGKPGRVWFLDGDSIEAPADIEEVDLAAETKTLLAPPPAGEIRDEFDVLFLRMKGVATGSAGVPEIVRAAWLAKLGQEELAAKMIGRLKEDDSRFAEKREGEEPHERLLRSLRFDLAWRAYADAVHAFMQRADEESLRHATRFLKLYPEFESKFGNGRELLTELERRKQAKTLSQASAEKPAEFDRWEAKRKIAWLIEQLDQVDARQWGQPGGVDLADDWRVEALIAIGDPAVESLIDVIEKDRRLTRSVHFWRDFDRSRTVLSVREAALTATMSILKLRVFAAASTGDNFTSHGDEAAAKTAESLRWYWKEYGGLPFEDRMMKVLTAKTSTAEAMREAAENLAQLGRRRTLGTTVFSDVEKIGSDETLPNPAVNKFKNPTAAEAMLAAMDRELNAHDKQDKSNSLWSYERRKIESIYLDSLTRLGDKRIAKELQRRAETATTLRMRRAYALASHLLGEPKPLEALAEEFRTGRIELPPNDQPHTNWEDQPGSVEFVGFVRAFCVAETSESNAALMALAESRHPIHRLAVEAIRRQEPRWHDGSAWFAHPFCLKLLRIDLDDKTKTGTIASITADGERYQEESIGGSSTGGIPEIIANPVERNERAELRRCDEAAAKLHELVIGLPPYHPLLKDAERRIAEMRTQLDKTMGPLRRATSEERKQRGHYWHPLYVAE